LKAAESKALIGANHRKPNPKNRVGEIAESAVTAFALEHPAFGQLRVSNELRKRGIFVSPSGVRSVWEIETAHPGYLGSQDTFYVGTIKGVGRIYQQTFSDTYSKWAAAKLCTTKMPITPADLLNDEVLAVRIEAQRIAASRNRMATSCIWP
jgi:hypothetical protein